MRARVYGCCYCFCRWLSLLASLVFRLSGGRHRRTLGAAVRRSNSATVQMGLQNSSAPAGIHNRTLKFSGVYLSADAYDTVLEGKNGFVLSSTLHVYDAVLWGKNGLMMSSSLHGYDAVLEGKNGIMLSSTLHVYDAVLWGKNGIMLAST